jgi:hypothetical protein
MAFVRPKALIRARTITAENGLSLAGAVGGSYNAFSAIMDVGDTTYGTVVEPGTPKISLTTFRSVRDRPAFG